MENNIQNVLRIGDTAPDFTANSTLGTIKLSDYKGKWLVFFSHPGSFTPVCTTEFIAFSKFYPEFLRRNTYLLALSLDSTPSNLAWIYNIYRSTGIQIPFPVISDRNANISRLYGTLSSDNVNNTRKVYILDPNQQIRAIIDYPANIGRNIAEILRVIDALQISDKDNVLTPANWLPSQPVINYPPTSYDQLVDVSKNANNLNCLDWYLCYKQLNDNFPALDNENPFLNNCNTNQNFR